MSILGAFYLLFKSIGIGQVKKDEESLEKSGDKLTKSLKNTKSWTDQTSDSFKKMGKDLIAPLTAAVSLGAVLAGIKNSLNYAVDLDQASQSLAVNIEELDAWDNAVKRIGGTAEGFQGSLRNLANRLGTTGQVALEVLPQLADSFQQMGRFSAIRYGETLGLDEKTILLLQKGRMELDELIKQQKLLGVVSKEDAEAAREFNYAWEDATHSLRTAFMGVAIEMIPTLIKAINLFGKAAQFFSQHSDLIVGGLIAIGIASVFAFPELYLGIAIVAGLASVFALLYEDIKYFIKGYDSYIGRLLHDFPILRREMEAFVRLFKDIYRLGTWLNNTVNLDKIVLGDQKTDTQNGKPEKNSLTISDDEIENLKNSANLDHAKKILDIVDNSSLNYTSGANLQKYAIPSAGNKSVTVNTGPINIETRATDAGGIAQAFTDRFTEQMNQANNYFDDGVKI